MDNNVYGQSNSLVFFKNLHHLKINQTKVVKLNWALNIQGILCSYVSHGASQKKKKTSMLLSPPIKDIIYISVERQNDGWSCVVQRERVDFALHDGQHLYTLAIFWWGITHVDICE